MTGWEQLKTLQEFSRRTGALHEAQLLQLKTWPLVMFPHLKKHSFSWDVGEHRVFFKLLIDRKKTVPRNLRARFTALDHNVKEMLGDEWSVEITAAGKKLYTSHGRVTPTPNPSSDDSGNSAGGTPQPA